MVADSTESLQVMMIPEFERSEKPSLMIVPHPRLASDKMAVMVMRDIVYGLETISPDRGSFFIDNYIEKNKSLVFAAQVDPVLLVLPMLFESLGLDRDMKDLALVPADFSSKPDHAEAFTALLPLARPNIDRICDVQTIGDDNYYELSAVKIKAYLRAKYDRLMTHLTAGGGPASPISSPGASDIIEKRMKVQAASIVCDLTPRWAAEILLADVDLTYDAIFSAPKKKSLSVTPDRAGKGAGKRKASSKSTLKTPTGKRSSGGRRTSLSPGQSLLSSFLTTPQR
ncbi:Ribonuclease H2, subunit B [Carpediemonas membranifera]|uniref:Ribonuclease H2, subunit B n=1 Tax=Carpediemonas membranifera TaxID=201153 RepID=A0A8J6AQN2_9EUKA|nr:Ribonuclease H2, subunit B [Carpediemonas membranifera]|eukprot:KAG9391666.1 Ribonuclease H2, subunit B [Carpediemonas membranifera]